LHVFVFKVGQLAAMEQQMEAIDQTQTLLLMMVVLRVIEYSTASFLLLSSNPN
jgi:hypothetical protein